VGTLLPKHNVTSENTVIFVFIAVRTSVLIKEIIAFA
jgi:hypothetical protein